jgi:RNA polymerase sigma-70 factor, ECF subfamily
MEPMHIDLDWPLVNACQKGDESAFTQLYEKYSKKISGFAHKYLSDAQHAEDVVQEVFIQVYRKIENFRGDARFSTWLFRVTLNACKTKVHKLERQRRIQELSSRKRREQPVQSPAMELGVRELHARIARSLAELSAEQRRILVMKTINELSYVEIGERMNQSENQVRGKLYRARKILRKSLESTECKRGSATPIRLETPRKRSEALIKMLAIAA